MRRYTTITLAVALAPSLAAQAPAPRDSTGVMLAFATFADIFGSRLVDAFDSIPAGKYDYRPTAVQQTIGYIAQHLENANYSLCDRLADRKHATTAKDSLADTVKARWPKDTLVSRLRESLRYCDTVLEHLGSLDSPAHASTLLGFETDLAEHYSQLSVYMRLLGMVPPSALPPNPRVAIDLPATALSPYVGLYQLTPQVQLEVTMQGNTLFIRSSNGGATVQLWPESRTDFFVKEVDAQIKFTRDANGSVTSLVLHQYGRDRPATKVRTAGGPTRPPVPSTTWIDATATLDPAKTPVYEGNAPLEFRFMQDMRKGDPVTLSAYSLGAHSGTHIDAPMHFIRDGAPIDKLPLDALIGPARVIDIADSVQAITAAELNRHDWKGAARVLFRTRSARRGWMSSPTFHHDFTYIAPDAAQLLADAGVRLVGIDYISAEQYGASAPRTHQILLKKGIPIVEGMALDSVSAGDYDLIVLPMKVAGHESAPARAALRKR